MMNMMCVREVSKIDHDGCNVQYLIRWVMVDIYLS